MLDTTLDNVLRFTDKKWVEVYDYSSSAEDMYKPTKEIRFKTSMLQSDLCDFSDGYIVFKGMVTLTKDADRNLIDVRNRFLALKNNGLSTNCIPKINNVLIDNAEDLDVVIPMYDLIQYSKNYRKTTGSLWNHYRDEANSPPLNPPVGNNPLTINYNADPITNSASFKYKTSITGKTLNTNQENGKNTEQGITNTKTNLENVLPLKHLSNFWKTLNMPLINCEVSPTLCWSKNCVLTDITTQTERKVNPNADPSVETSKNRCSKCNI